MSKPNVSTAGLSAAEHLYHFCMCIPAGLARKVIKLATQSMFQADVDEWKQLLAADDDGQICSGLLLRIRKPNPERGIWEQVVRSGPCVTCGTLDDIQADHIYPFSKGGSHSRSNLQPMCGRCNQQKKDRA